MKAVCVWVLSLLLAVQESKSVETSTSFIKLSGNTEYTSSLTRTLTTSSVIEYHFGLYESRNKKWGLHIAGKINPSYDIFGNEIKMDVFTVFGIDY